MLRLPAIILGAGACVAAALLLTACSGQSPLACESSQRYANSRTSSPWRIPDDLSAPKESDALQIPAVPGQSQANARPAGASGQTSCLESPPPFVQQGQQDGAAQSVQTPEPAQAPERRRRRRRRGR